MTYRLLSGPTAQKHATVMSPPAANRIPMYRTASDSVQPNWSMHRGVPRLEREMVVINWIENSKHHTHVSRMTKLTRYKK